MRICHLLQLHDFVLELLRHLLVADHVAQGQASGASAHLGLVLSVHIRTVTCVVSSTLFLGGNGLHGVGGMSCLNAQVVRIVGSRLRHVARLVAVYVKAVLVRFRAKVQSCHSLTLSGLLVPFLG